jgi:hypothetical protein
VDISFAMADLEFSWPKKCNRRNTPITTAFKICIGHGKIGS